MHSRAGVGIWTQSAVKGGTRTALLLGWMVTAVTFAGCPTPETPDAGPVPSDPELAFLSPLHNATLTQADDLDGSLEGIQINVRVLVDPDKAITVKLLLDDEEVGTSDVKDGRARFANVTLSSSPEGVEHTLRAEAPGYKSDSITVTARENVLVPSCEIVAPAASTVESPFNVAVACLNVHPNEPASLRVFDVNDAQVGPTYTGTLDGNRRFTVSSISLGAGSYRLAFSLDEREEGSAEKQIVVEESIVVPDPVCTITAPSPDEPPTSSPGFTVTVECEDVPEDLDEVTVTLSGPTTDPVSFTRALTPTGDVLAAVVPVVAAEPGLTEISAELTGVPSSADTVLVEVPAFPVCDAEIRQPADGATNLIDIDLEEEGNQITVVVGAAGNPGACTGAEVALLLDGDAVASGVLAGNEAQSGEATFVITVPEGPSELSATLTIHGGEGVTDTVNIVFTTLPVSARLVGIPDCGGFGEGCFNLSHPNEAAGPAYQRTLTVEAAAHNGACPFTAPVLDVEGGAQGIQADDSGSGPWTLADGRCTATFSLVTLHADESPDGVVKTLTLTTGLVGGDPEVREFELGLDRVAPTLVWTDAGGNPITEALMGQSYGPIRALTTGMEGRGIVLVESEDQSTTLATCVPDSTGACAFSPTLIDGDYELDVVGADAAGNALVNATLPILIDTRAPCVETIAVSADANHDGIWSADEAAITDVTVTFGPGSSCGIEDGRTVTLVSTVGGDIATATTSGNVALFTEITLGDGQHTISVDGTDAAGNAVVTADAALQLLVARTPPTCQITAPVANLDASHDEDASTPGLQVTVTVASDGNDVSLTRDGALLGSGTPSGGAFSVANVSVDEGASTFEATCTDAAGNTATATLPVTATLTPTCAFTAPGASLDASDDENTTDPGLQVTATVASDGNQVSIRLNGVELTSGSPSAGALSATNVTVPNGVSTFAATCSNQTARSTTVTHVVTVDADGPDVAWSFTTPTVRLTRNATDGGADLGPLDASNAPGYQATLEATVDGCDGRPVVVMADGTQVNAGAPPTAGTNPVNLPVDIPDGTYTLVVSCTDALGQTGSHAVTAIVDTTPPEPPTGFTAVLNPAQDATRLGWVDLDFTPPADAETFSFVASHADVVDFDNPDPTVPFVRFDVPVSATLPITTGADGVPALWFGPQTWTIALRVTDAAGNASEVVKATVSFNLMKRDIQHVDVEGGVADRFGYAVSTGRGDLNGDGIDDVVVSAYRAGPDCSGTRCNGALMIVYGAATAMDFMVQSVQYIEGLPQEILGWEVAIVPSINGDDIDDLLVAAYEGGTTPAVYVYYGRPDGAPLPARPDFIVRDPIATNFGVRLAGLGDVNGDGIGDWVAVDHGDGSAPAAYIFFGDATLDLSASPFARADLADVTLVYPASDSTVASGFASLENLNNDFSAAGHPLGDFAVGAAYIAGADQTGGRVYLLHGRESWPDQIVLSDSLAAPDLVLSPGTSLATRVGTDLSFADINGDGQKDLVAKGLLGVVVFLNAGGVFPAAGSYALLSDTATSGPRTGLSIGDLNGDGMADILVSAQRGAWLYFGDQRENGDRIIPDVQAEEAVGAHTILQIGDVDGDGFDDIGFVNRDTQVLHLRFGP